MPESGFDHEVPEAMLRQVARGEIPCPYCRGSKVYEHVEVDSRSISIFDPCPYCDPNSPRNAIPRLQQHLDLAVGLLRRLQGRVPGALYDEIEDTLDRIESETPPDSD